MNVINNIKTAFLNLKNKNRFFVSEADFQHSFAMELEKVFNGDAVVLLEFPIEQQNRIIYVDIMVVYKNELYPIELKYKTKTIESDSLYMNTNIPVKRILRKQGAQDLAGYELWKDINRIETLIKDGFATSGVCIFITNDMYYLRGKCDVDAQAFAFRLGTGSHYHGAYHWNIDTKTQIPSYINKKKGFYIYNDYLFDWQDFYMYDAVNGIFKFLFLEIPRHTGEKYVK